MLIFITSHKLSQTVTFLGSLFSFRKRKNHENNENMVKRNSFFITFHKLCQTVTFWGRYLASETVKNMKRIKTW